MGLLWDACASYRNMEKFPEKQSHVVNNQKGFRVGGCDVRAGVLYLSGKADGVSQGFSQDDKG